MSIDIDNIGAIERVRIPAPDGGGLVILKGTHGVGKSTALSAVQSALRKDGRLPLRDGADRGNVSACGATIRVTRGKTQHGGSLDVASIEGRFSLSDLIDPGIADPERSDAARVKALVELSGTKADATLFAGIAPEPIRGRSDDLVSLAAIAKKEWEQVARDAEAAAAVALDKAKRESPPEGAVVVGAVDASELRERQRKAAARLTELQTADRIASEAAAKHADVAKQLEAIDEAALAADVESKTTAQKSAMEHATDCAVAANELRERLKIAESKLAVASKLASDAVRERTDAAAKLDQARKLKAALESSVPPRVDQGELNAAAQETTAIEAAIKTNDEITRNAAQMQKAAEHFALADAHNSRAKKYREAAVKIDGVLSSVVAGMGCRLRVAEGRLVLDTHRGAEKFGELSHGERTLEAIDVALSVLPHDGTGVLVVDQETFSGLHDRDKAELAAKARTCNVLVLAAEVTEDAELVAEVA